MLPCATRHAMICTACSRRPRMSHWPYLHSTLHSIACRDGDPCSRQALQCLVRPRLRLLSTGKVRNTRQPLLFDCATGCCRCSAFTACVRRLCVIRYELAEYHFRRALAVNPHSSVLRCYLGLVTERPDGRTHTAAAQTLIL